MVLRPQNRFAASSDSADVNYSNDSSNIPLATSEAASWVSESILIQ